VNPDSLFGVFFWKAGNLLIRRAKKCEPKFTFLFLRVAGAGFCACS